METVAPTPPSVTWAAIVLPAAVGCGTLGLAFVLPSAPAVLLVALVAVCYCVAAIVRSGRRRTPPRIDVPLGGSVFETSSSAIAYLRVAGTGTGRRIAIRLIDGSLVKVPPTGEAPGLEALARDRGIPVLQG